MQSLAVIIHLLHTVQNMLIKNVHWYLPKMLYIMHKIQYTKKKIQKFVIQFKKFRDSPIQNVLRYKGIETREPRPMICPEWKSWNISSLEAEVGDHKDPIMAQN